MPDVIRLPMIGAYCKIGPPDSRIDGTLVAVCVENGLPHPHLTCKVAWWDGRTRKSEWFAQTEVDFDVEDYQVGIGFDQNAR